MKNCIENYQALYEYMKSVSLRECEILKRLREETTRLLPDLVKMQISPDQGQFMSLLVRMIGAKKVLEIGTFTGYSALALALALPEDGRVIACDINTEWTHMAKAYWKEAGVLEKIDLFLQPAIETLDQFIGSGEENTFDFIFIDADKENYETYYEMGLRLLRKNGLLVIDNVFWKGNVIDPKATDLETSSIRKLNEKIHRDERVDISMLSVGDGIFLVRKTE